MKHYSVSLWLLLASCASQRPIGTTAAPAYPTTVRSKQIRQDYLGPNDLRRVRNPEFVKTYHLGRTPTRDGRVMHEAHRVYQLEKSPRWNLLRDNPTLASTGPARRLRDAAFRPLPTSNQVSAEKQRQRELTAALENAHNQTAAQLEALKAKAALQSDHAETIRRLSEELQKEREARALEQPKTPSNESKPADNNAERLRQWGDEQEQQP